MSDVARKRTSPSSSHRRGLCTDNGAMVAATARFYAGKGLFSALDMRAFSRMRWSSDRVLKKSLGQHLLKDRNLLEKMVRLAGIGAEDAVVEIGPGQGDLTRCIAAKALAALRHRDG